MIHFKWSLTLPKKFVQQECILVGCVLSAAVAVSPATHVHPPPPAHTYPPAIQPPLPHTHPTMHTPHHV